MEYKTNDGWDLDNIYPLQEFKEAYDSINKEVYELNNCRRKKSCSIFY